MKQIITIDESKKPFIIISSNRQLSSETDTNLYIDIMSEFYKKHQSEKLIIIYDLSTIKAIGNKGRKIIGMWLGENIELINNAVAGVCYVSINIIHKIILEGIFSFNKPIWPFKIIKSVNEGFEWGKKILKTK